MSAINNRISSENHLAEAVDVFPISLSAPRGPSLSPGRHPESLWIGFQKHKEAPPGYRHAWGTAYVSSTPDGGTPYKVSQLRFIIRMPDLDPGKVCIFDETHKDVSSIDGECKVFGAVFGDFQAEWGLELDDIYYGKHTKSTRW